MDKRELPPRPLPSPYVDVALDPPDALFYVSDEAAHREDFTDHMASLYGEPRAIVRLDLGVAYRAIRERLPWGVVWARALGCEGIVVPKLSSLKAFEKAYEDWLDRLVTLSVETHA